MKVGVDDFLAADKSVVDLFALAQPWDGNGPGIWLRETEESDVATLQRELAEAKALNSALVQTFLNPNLTHAEKMAAIAVSNLTQAKHDAGQVEPDGRVVLSASEVADDWRPAPNRGEHVASLNPKSGTKPRMPRSSVRPILKEAVDRGVLRAEVRGTIRRREDGSTYKDWELLVDPAVSVANALDAWARWTPDTPKLRKIRESRACPSCGEVHPIKITRVGYCTGCGAQVGEPAPAPPTNPRGSLSPMSEFFSDIQTTSEPPSSPPLVRNVGNNFRQEEPPYLADAPDPLTPDGSAPYWHDLTDVQELIATASHAPTLDEEKQALSGLESRLSTIAKARGKTPVPKPAPLPNMPAERQPDPWTDEVWL
jgi:hypothetical protein